jgi:putative phosphotransacetylase
MALNVPIARSDIHIHLKRSDLETLFGKDYKLESKYDLTIPGQFASTAEVKLYGPSGSIEGVVVVGPERPYTQVEISVTNGLKLGIDAPVRSSGDIAGTPGIIVEGLAGKVQLDKGVIVAARHIHMHTSEAEAAGLRNGDIVKVKIDGKRALVFKNVIIKSGPYEALEMHVDFDEGHAAGIVDFQLAEIITS